MTFLCRNWFPIALAAVFLLSLPGLVLCVLNIAGGAAAANAWLEENLALTFHPELPPPVLFLILLLPLLLLILYFLKLKRKPLQVPSTFLWKKTIEDLHVNSLLQWLRKNILLILQLLILVVLIYAVMNVRFHASTTRGRFYVLLIDNSASMAAKDMGVTRLEWAKREALKMINAKGSDDWGMIIAFNSSAKLIRSPTRNRDELRQGLEEIEQSSAVSRIDDALILAENQVNQVRSIENLASQADEAPPGGELTIVQPKGALADAYLFSDGRFRPISEALLRRLNAAEAGATTPLGNLALRYMRAGKPGAEQVNNLGIVAFDAGRHTPDLIRIDRTGPQKLLVQVTVKNYRATPVKAAQGVTLKVDLFINGELHRPMKQVLEMDGRTVLRTKEEGQERDQPGEATVPFHLPPMSLNQDIVMHAYLDGNKDDFSMDDEAWLVCGSVRKARVILIGGKNPVLDAFFEQDALKQLATVERLAAEDLGKSRYLELARSGQADLFLFDRCTPLSEGDLPSANTIFIGRPPPPWIRGKKLEHPKVLISDRKHSLLRHITTVSDVGVVEGFAFDIKNDLDPAVKADKKRTLPGMSVLLESTGNVPLVFALQRGPYQDLVLAFPLVDEGGDLVTNWPLLPSFPIFLRNVLYGMGNVEDAVRAPFARAGEVMRLRPEMTVRKLTITPARGKAQVLERGASPTFNFGDTDKLGLYRVQRDDGLERGFAVNLLDSLESNLEPVAAIQLGDKRVAAEGERSTPWDLWKWILLAGLALLVLEWSIYNRRVAL